MPALAARKTSMPVVPEQARASTLKINALHGGLPEGHEGLPSPMVPDSCRLVIDRRFLMEESLDQVRGEIIDILEDLQHSRPGFRYRIDDIMTVHPTITEPNAPVVKAVSEAVERVLGRPAETVVSPGTYDQKHIARIGKLEDCIAYGPGILDLAHQTDEFIEIGDMLQAAKVMATASYTLLTGKAE